MSDLSQSVATPVYVPVALSENEAVAVKSAAMVVFTSGSVRLPLDHPLYTGALKIEEAWRKAKEGAEAQRVASAYSEPRPGVGATADEPTPRGQA